MDDAKKNDGQETQSAVILSFLVCFFTGVFWGYYPALKAPRLDSIEALHCE